MSDPRNVAHAKKVIQAKKHHGAQPGPADAQDVRPGKKPVAAKVKHDGAGTDRASDDAAAVESAMPSHSAAPEPPATLQGSLVVLAKLKDLEFHSRANLELLAELAMTIEDELKQKDMAGPLSDVYSAQNAFQTKVTALIEAYKAECDRLQGDSV